MSEKEIDTSEVVALEQQLAELTTNPKFVEAFKQARDLEAKIKEGLKRVQGAMELAHVKKLEGDWGYITLVERTTIKVLDEKAIPAEFMRLQPDVKAISSHIKLTNVTPPGVMQQTTSFLRKGIK